MDKNIIQNQKKKKNNWSKSKVDEALKKINNEIYKRNKQASIQIKLDDLSEFINNKITARGIAKGMVFVQEDFNRNILKIEKTIISILLINDIHRQINLLNDVKKYIKLEIWPDIRFLMIHKAITPGEITELIKRQSAIDDVIEKWEASMHIAISANR
mgnify:CR=1 FL=1